MSPEPEFSLVMPFVVCASNGGPYEDVAFVAGYECGMVEAALQTAPATERRTVRSANLPQLDLIAMRLGFVMAITPWKNDPEWSLVTFTKVGT